MKTDSIFYCLFQTFPSAFFELINLQSSEANAYNFASVELKQTAFRIDGVFLSVADTNSHPIYFVEVKCPPYKQLRVLAYPLPDSKAQKNDNATGGS